MSTAAAAGPEAPSPERARLFVALDLPGEARAALSRWRNQVIAGQAALRGVASEMLHVTLCFLGSQPVAEVDAIATACEAAAPARDVGPGGEFGGMAGGFPLTVTGAVWLPRRRPHVLAVTLAESGERLAGFQRDLATRLQVGGWYPPEDRRFLAHVTVARVRSRTRLRPFPLPSPPALALTASSFTLYRSRTESGGARYEALATFALG